MGRSRESPKPTSILSSGSTLDVLEGTRELCDCVWVLIKNAMLPTFPGLCSLKRRGRICGVPHEELPILFGSAVSRILWPVART